METESSNQPDGRWTAEELEQIRERAKARAQEFEPCVGDLPVSDIPPMPSTLHNVHNQRRVIT